MVEAVVTSVRAGPRPPSFQPPSYWLAAVAPPQKKPCGNLLIAAASLHQNGEQLAAGLDGTFGGGHHIQIVVGVGDDHGGLCLIARLFNGRLVKGDQKLALGDLVPLLHMGGEVFPVQPDGVHADVDEDLRPVRGHQAKGVVGGKKLADHAVAG